MRRLVYVRVPMPATGPRIAWPPGVRSAAAFTFDFDAESVWLADDPANAHRPGVLSQGVYGARVGVPLILDLLRARRVTATFFVPGVVAERYPERVEQIVADGHELGVHGYTHTPPAQLSAAEEEHELVLALEVLRRFADDVTGYRSPSWDFGPHTLDLLDRLGLRYSSNLMDDLWPYLHPGTSVVELPVQWLLDDAAHFWFSAADWTRTISPAARVEVIWREEFDGVRGLGGACVFTMHPQVIGRPGRLAMLDRMIEHVVGTGDTWIAPLGRIAAHAGEVLRG
jgi:peptidoglycan-N-acetylglucosamine deacetylase